MLSVCNVLKKNFYTLIFNYKGLERVEICVFSKNSKKNEFYSQRLQFQSTKPCFLESSECLTSSNSKISKSNNFVCQKMSICRGKVCFYWRRILQKTFIFSHGPETCFILRLTYCKRFSTNNIPFHSALLGPKTHAEKSV